MIRIFRNGFFAPEMFQSLKSWNNRVASNTNKWSLSPSRQQRICAPMATAMTAEKSSSFRTERTERKWIRNWFLGYARNILKRSQWMAFTISFSLDADKSTSHRMLHTNECVPHIQRHIRRDERKYSFDLCATNANAGYWCTTFHVRALQLVCFRLDYFIVIYSVMNIAWPDKNS